MISPSNQDIAYPSRIGLNTKIGQQNKDPEGELH